MDAAAVAVVTLVVFACGPFTGATTEPATLLGAR